ncbi:MAG TPA: S8/S53 family peptidase [Frankiaceae bacterium]|nr:S8/S53 family peptidase [Frankiaceae bacterium]
MSRRRAVVTALGLLGAVTAAPPTQALNRPAPVKAHVVVATLDTGGNPFHPTWRRAERRHPSAFIPGYPRSARAVSLRFGTSFEKDVAASEKALERFGDNLTYVPGTNIIGAIAHPTDKVPVFDPAGSTNSHGSAASSQIAGAGLGFSPDAYVVIVDRTADGGSEVYRSNADLLRWAADQPWIDVIHTNIQNPAPAAGPTTPQFPGYPEAVAYALSKGKVVVSAGGNFYGEPTETSPHAGPPGVLVAGANDNCGYTTFSNPDPHVVSDGMGTPSAVSTGYGTGSFSGTSSASPRISGYVAELLLRVRRAVSYTGSVSGGALVTVPSSKRPKSGPLADGKLTSAEVHEVVRKTADPMSHASKFDGTGGADCVPQAAAGPYAKMGYGEVSEHTLGAAVDVVLGRKPLPARPQEEPFYAASEALRAQVWS